MKQVVLVMAIWLLTTVTVQAQQAAEEGRPRIHFWDLLLQQPGGVFTPPPPECVQDDATCKVYDYWSEDLVVDYGDCCTDTASCSEARFDNDPAILEYIWTCCTRATLQERCSDNSDCCSDLCVYTGPDPSDFACDRYNTISRIGALSGSTLVNTLEAAAPVALQDVQVGQHVPCLGTVEDLSLAPSTRWCEVKAWVASAPQLRRQRQLTLVLPGGVSTVFTATETQLLQVPTSQPTAADAKPGITGAYHAIKAADIKAGDKVLMKLKSSDPKSPFVLATVEAAKDVKTAGGAYKPMIDAPYMLADGLVVPMYDRSTAPTAKVPQDVRTAAARAQHHLLAPLYTQKLQAVGTPAKSASWDGEHIWSHWEAIDAYIRGLVKAQDAKALAEIDAWYKQHHAAWVSKKTAVGVQDVLKLLPETKIEGPMRAPLPPKTS